MCEETRLLIKKVCNTEYEDGGNSSYESIAASSLTEDIASFYTFRNRGDMVKSFNQSTLSYKSVTESLKTIVSRGNVLLSLAETVTDDRAAGLFLTISNMLPIIQGSLIFGMPFAVLSGGLTFIPVGVLLCIMADICGTLLVDCLYEKSPRSGEKKRVRGSFRKIAETCWGNFGGKIVNCLNLTNMIAHNIVSVVVLGQCSHRILRTWVSLTEKQTMVCFSALLVPAMFIPKLSAIGYISFVGMLSVFIGQFASLLFFIQHYSHWSHYYDELPTFNRTGFPLAIGILMYSLCMNVILPEIEGTMTNRSRISFALHLSYGFSTIIKFLYGMFGALTFGLSTNQLVILNISEYSVAYKYLLTILLSMYSISSFALMYFVLFQQLDAYARTFGCGIWLIEGRGKWVWVIISRIFGVLFCLGIAYIMPFYALICGVFGAFTGMFLVFIFPLLFHLQLKWMELSVFKIVLEICLLLVAIITGILATYSSVNALIIAIRTS